MKHNKIAFITGIAGQDGAYLASFLVRKGCDVHGLFRWDSHIDPLDGLGRLDALGLVDDAITMHAGDLTDAQAMTVLIKKIKPDEIYNLGALSQVGISFETPASTMDINLKGILAIYEALLLLDMAGHVRVYQASSSEMYGCAPPPQNEETRFDPCSPYGVAKSAAFMMTRMYRKAHGIHASNGILFNHESPMRGEDFVTRKITGAVAKIEAGGSDALTLGNLNSVRDWGHARDYVRGMWMMLQQDKADDYVLATGQAHSVREFVERAFAQIGTTIEWCGVGVDEVGRDLKTKEVMVRVCSELFRSKDVNSLLGDASKARRILGWRPEVCFDDLVSEMVNSDRQKLQKKFLKDHVQWQQAG